MNRAIFLDRDNTLIHNDSDLGDPALVKLIQGAASAIASLRGLGYKIVVVTNQGGVARGKYGEAEVEQVNNRVNELIKASTGAMIDRFYYCPFHPEGTVEKYAREHPWRKPQSGMILQAIKDLDLDPRQCWMIGDQMRDIQAGAGAHVRTILLRPDAGEQPPLLQSAAAAQLLHGTVLTDVMPDFVARNLIEAVRIVAQQRRPEGLDDARLAGTTATTGAPRAKAGEGSAPAPASAPARQPPVSQVPPVASPPPPPLAPQLVAAAKPAPLPLGRSPAAVSSATPTFAEPSTAQADSSATAIGMRRLPPTTISTAQPVSAEPPSAAATAASPVPAPAPGASSTGISRSAAPATEPTRRTEDTPATAGGSVEHSLRQILQELRNLRPVGGEVSYVAVLAIVTQMVAVLCLLGALWLGRTEDSTFWRWLGTGVFVQLATIALLLFHRRS